MVARSFASENEKDEPKSKRSSLSLYKYVAINDSTTYKQITEVVEKCPKLRLQLTSKTWLHRPL
jgi:hypothetical protein